MDGLGADFILKMSKYIYLEKNKFADLVSNRLAKNSCSFPLYFYDTTNGQCCRPWPMRTRLAVVLEKQKSVASSSDFFISAETRFLEPEWLCTYYHDSILFQCNFYLKLQVSDCCHTFVNMNSWKMLEILGKRKKIKDILGKMPFFHANQFHPSQLQEQMETHLEMCSAMTNVN